MTINILDLNQSLQAAKTAGVAAATALLSNAVAGIPTAKAILACHACNSGCWLCVFPRLTTCVGAVCAFDTTFYRCGSTCTWTVPAGATVAKFEVWGPGAFSGAGMCCGGSPFGPTGAYGTIVIPVTPGSQYIMCGGCSACIQVSCTQNCVGQGSASYITGPGLNNFCAQGGCHNLVRRNEMQRTELCNKSAGCCRWQNPTCDSSGNCICGSSYYCAQSCATCGLIPVFNDKAVTFFGTPFGHNSIHGSHCHDSNHYGFDCHPVLVSIADGITPVAACCFMWDSGNCCGVAFNTCNGYCCHPGIGGFPTHAMGGATSLCGGYGRHGAAKISWC